MKYSRFYAELLLLKDGEYFNKSPGSFDETLPAFCGEVRRLFRKYCIVFLWLFLLFYVYVRTVPFSLQALLMP